MSRVYLSSSCLCREHVVDAVRELASITPRIELSGGSCYRADSLEALRTAKTDLGLDYLLHGYFPPPAVDFLFNFADGSAATRDFVATAMRFVRALGVPYYSVHAGFRKNFLIAGESLFDGTGMFTLDDIAANIRWFGEVFPETPLAIENLYPVDGNVATCFAMTVDEIAQLLGYDERTRLLLDLGHLQVSAHHLGFDFAAAAEELLTRHAERIIEIHLSENAGVDDDHGLITAESSQYRLLVRHREEIKRYGINLTIEARGQQPAALAASHTLVQALFEEDT